MFCLKRLATLIEKDVSEFFSSKSWIIVLILPLFITFLYAVIYRQAESKVFALAYQPALSRSIQLIFSDPYLKLRPYQNLALAKKALSEGRVDGVILDTSLTSNRIRLLVDKSRARETAFVINAINSAILHTYVNEKVPLIKPVYINQSIPTRWISLPIWLIQIILTVCLLQASAAIADEKERQTLHSLFVSPMTFSDYLFAKLLWNTVVGIGAILLTLILTGAAVNFWTILIFGFLGSMAYSTISILIGLFTPGALFARTVATLTYIISALPMMVKDLSFTWKGALYFLPSYLLMAGLDRALLANPFNSQMILSGTGLLAEIGILLAIIYFALQYKADF